MIGRHRLPNGHLLQSVLVSLNHLGHGCVSDVLRYLELLLLAPEILRGGGVAEVFDFVHYYIAVANVWR